MEIANKQGVGRNFVIALTIVFFAVTISSPITALLSLDIAHTFFPASFAEGASQAAGAAAVGAVAQIVTANTVFEAIFAVAMGFIAVRFKFRPLLLIGVAMVLLSALCSYFAPTLTALAICSALEGGGTVMVGITGFSMVGAYMTFDKKAKTISYLVATTTFVSLIGAPIVTAITDFGGWRLNYLLFSVPISATGLLLAYYIMPRQREPVQVNSEKNPYLTGLKSVVLNRSAVLCLVAGMLGGTGIMGTFALAFYRQYLGLSLSFASLVMMIAVAMYVVASLLVGRFVNRIGARSIGITCAFANGVLMMIFFFMPVWYFALPLDMAHVWFGAAVFTAYQCLTLDQVPLYRPTMMSMRSLFLSLGVMVGAALGGTVLIVVGSYQAVGILFGILSIISAVAFIGTKDTTKATLTP